MTQIKIKTKNNSASIIMIFNSLYNFSLISVTALDYIHQSLKMKISKKIAEHICKTGLKVKNYENNKIEFELVFNGTNNFNISKSLLEIPNEGDVILPHELSSFSISAKKTLIDILIVDDIEFNIEILKRIIFTLKETCNCGNFHQVHSVHSASSGKEAISLVINQNSVSSGYKLIIMDCMMPEVDGWEATKEIRKLFEDKKINFLPSIIAYSAFDSKEDLEKCKSVGMCGHLSKPCSKEELCIEINHWINS